MQLETFLKEDSQNKKELISTNTYIPDPTNENMDRTKDKYGVSAGQNTIGLYGEEIIYIPDRSLMSIEYIDGDYAYVFSILKEKILKYL